MAKLLHLEEFKSATSGNRGVVFGASVAGQSEGPQSYEQGYQAGWEDAAEAASSQQSGFSAEFSNNLQDLGFTFHEARSHVVGSMESILSALIDTLLPEILADSIGARILEEITPLVGEAADRPIQIVVAPANVQLVEPLLSSKSGCPLELVEEPSLGVGQVFLRSGQLEREIDLDGAISKVKEAFSALMNNNRKVFAHG